MSVQINCLAGSTGALTKHILYPAWNLCRHGLSCILRCTPCYYSMYIAGTASWCLLHVCFSFWFCAGVKLMEATVAGPGTLSTVWWCTVWKVGWSQGQIIKLMPAPSNTNLICLFSIASVACLITVCAGLNNVKLWLSMNSVCNTHAQ